MPRAVAADFRASSTFASVPEVIEDIRVGKFVVVVDAADRENEGDLTIAAEFATPGAINFMARHARGLICLCLTEERCQELALRPMTSENEAPFGTAFTVSIEAREGVTTGISACDRARTIEVAIDPSKGSADVVSPGHVFPLRARAGGVLKRAGQTEAAVDLARLAGLTPAGVVCEVINDDGTMARRDDLVEYCREHGIKLVTIEDIIRYRRGQEKLVERVATPKMPTRYGEFRAVGFRDVLTGTTHLALVKGDVDGADDVLVRVHSECIAGDVFHSLHCDCRAELDLALRRIAASERGVLLYLSPDDRGLGCLDKLQGFELGGESTGGAEARLQLALAAENEDYGIGSQILAELGLTTITVLTNNPRRVSGIGGFGLRIVAEVALDEARPEAWTRARSALGEAAHRPRAPRPVREPAQMRLAGREPSLPPS